MALSAPAHRLHGVLNGGVFGGPSWSSLAGASHADASSFSAVPNTTRGRANLAILAARTAQANPHALAAPPTPVVTRPRRSSVRSVSVPDFVADALPPPRAASRAGFVHYSTPAAYAYPAVAPRPQNDNRTAKLVASVLLSRASGRPMRRRPQSPEEKTYVKSCLSRPVAVAVEA